MTMSDLPIEIDEKGSPWFGMVELILGIVTAGLLILVFLTELPRRGLPSSSIYLVLALSGVIFIYGGLHILVFRKRIEIDEKTVYVATRDLIKSEEWREPLTRYNGIKLTSKPRYKPDNLPMPGRMYTVSLVHPDEGKLVILYREVTLSRAVERWSRVSDLIGLPRIETAAVKREREAYLS